MNLSNKIERRKHDRIKVRWPVTVFTDHGMIKGETGNITVDGIFICCEEPLRLNEIFPASMDPPNHQTIWFTGKAIWSDFYAVDDQGTAFGTGICFVKVSDGDRHFFDQVVSAHPE